MVIIRIDNNILKKWIQGAHNFHHGKWCTIDLSTTIRHFHIVTINRQNIISYFINSCKLYSNKKLPFFKPLMLQHSHKYSSQAIISKKRQALLHKRCKWERNEITGSVLDEMQKYIVVPILIAIWLIDQQFRWIYI